MISEKRLKIVNLKLSTRRKQWVFLFTLELIKGFKTKPWVQWNDPWKLMKLYATTSYLVRFCTNPAMFENEMVWTYCFRLIQCLKLHYKLQVFIKKDSSMISIHFSVMLLQILCLRGISDCFPKNDWYNQVPAANRHPLWSREFLAWTYQWQSCRFVYTAMISTTNTNSGVMDGLNEISMFAIDE